MLDRTIPFYNTILRCDRYLNAEPALQNGYEFRMYQSGDEQKWAQLEYEIGDFDSVEEGFKLQTTDTFSQYENQFDLAMNTLKKVLPENQYEELMSNIE